MQGITMHFSPFGLPFLEVGERIAARNNRASAG